MSRVSRKVDNFLALGLRQSAESKVKTDELLNANAISSEETQRLISELRVHQIELEMQNTELRRTQEELEASREKYFDLYDLAPVGYLSLDKAGVVCQANLTLACLLGVSRSALLKRALSSYILPTEQDIYYLWRQRLMTSGESQTCELQLVKNDGSTCLVLLTASPGRDGEFRVSLLDISRLRGEGGGVS